MVSVNDGMLYFPPHVEAFEYLYDMKYLTTASVKCQGFATLPRIIIALRFDNGVEEARVAKPLDSTLPADSL